MPPTQALPDAQSESTFTQPTPPPFALGIAIPSSVQVVLMYSSVAHICMCVCVYSWVHVTPAVDPTCSFPSPHLTSPHPTSHLWVWQQLRAAADAYQQMLWHCRPYIILQSASCTLLHVPLTQLPHPSSPPFWPVQKRVRSAIDDGIKSRWLITGYACTHLFYGLY